MSILALALVGHERFDEVEKMHWQALELRETVLGKEHPHTLTSMNNRAFVLQNLKTYEGCEQWYELALTLHEEILGGEHPKILGRIVSFAAMVRRGKAAGQA